MANRQENHTRCHNDKRDDICFHDSRLAETRQMLCDSPRKVTSGTGFSETALLQRCNPGRRVQRWRGCFARVSGAAAEEPSGSCFAGDVLLVMYSSGPPKPGAVVGFVGTLGHRSVGGMRISLYNAIYTSIGPGPYRFHARISSARMAEEHTL